MQVFGHLSNRVDPDQNVPSGEVRSGTAPLFAARNYLKS